MIRDALAGALDLQAEILGRALDHAADLLGWISDASGDWSETCRWWALASRQTP